ncbi:type IV secretion system protein [Erythrobacter sp. MTPC3]|uniref:type IV secretion system protein n=1 Tax=Erythrobacter sp. MTPC3 TaxID=3056564 RepID=UPI0036F34BB2
MACPAIITGEQFLVRVLSHIDCQAQVIGSYGYMALGQPGSVASTLVAGLLTLFIAFFGIRLLFGPTPGARDLVYDVLKIGIVLTLAFSWPAFRTVVYDVTLKGPAEIASVIQAGSGNANAEGFPARLQEVDNAVVQLTTIGTGRNTGQFIDQNEPGATFEGTALQDDSAFGSARLLYLASVIGSLALLRIGAGLLLALAPVVAALYFFNQTRGIFAGWLKGIVLTVAGSVGATMVLSVQLAILEPFLADAVRVRSLGYAVPSAPTELFAIMLAFAIVQLVMLWFLAKIVFNRGWLTLPDFARFAEPAAASPILVSSNQLQSQPQILRAERISNKIESSIRRENEYLGSRLLRSETPRTANAGEAPDNATRSPRLGNSYRRSATRPSRAATMRDKTS